MPDVTVYRVLSREHDIIQPEVINPEPLDSMFAGYLMALSHPEGGKFFITDHETSLVITTQHVDRVIPPFNPADKSGKSLSGQSNGIP